MELPEGQYEPGEQVKQDSSEVDPVSLQNVPSGHIWHTLCPVSLE
jgi:hypothetical protein